MVRILIQFQPEGESMPEDWVAKYMQQSWAKDDQEREIALRKARFVEDRATAFFKELWNQVDQDLGRFHNGGGDEQLKGRFLPEIRFVVERQDYPSVKLEVELKHGCIAYTRQLRTNQPNSPDLQQGQLPISSDLQGNLQVKRNGESFPGHPEVSEFLLMPVFEFIKKNR